MYSCQEEYDHYMSAQGEAEAQAEREAVEWETKVKEAIKFLAVDVGLNPQEYLENYEKLTYERE